MDAVHACPSDLVSAWRSEQRYLFFLCLHLTGGDEDEAKDVLGKLAVRAWEKLRSHPEPIANYRAWLTRLVQNLAVDTWRERASYGRALEHLRARIPLADERSLGADELHLQRELMAEILLAIDDLPPSLRETSRLRFVDELPHHDIAEKLRLSEEVIRKRVQVARGLLRGRLTRYLDPTD